MAQRTTPTSWTASPAFACSWSELAARTVLTRFGLVSTAQDYPYILDREPDFSIFSKDVVLQDLQGFSIRGKQVTKAPNRDPTVGNHKRAPK